MSDNAPVNIEKLLERRTQGKYPYIVIETVHDVTMLVVNNLEMGDMIVAITKDGTKKVAGRISPSAYNILKLLKTHGPITYCVSAEQSVKISSVAEYLEVVTWT